MQRWTVWRVLALGAGYVLVYLGVSAAFFLRWRAQHRQPDGSWKFLWLIPINYVRNYAAGLLLPPLMLLLVWLIARVLRGTRQAAV